MKKTPRILFLVVLIAAGFLGNLQPLHAQASVHDSLRQIITRLHDSSKDEKLKQTIEKIQQIYTGDAIQDTLAAQLLSLEDELMDATQLSRSTIISYARLLMNLLEHLPPDKESLAYAYSLYNGGRLYERTGQFKLAQPLHLQALQIRKKVLGKNYPEYVNSLNGVAYVYEGLGEELKALPLYLEALDITRKALGEEHPEYSIFLNNLASLYSKMGEYAKALPLLQQSRAIRKKNPGEESASYANVLSNLGLLYNRMGEYDKAIPLFQQALSIRKKISGEANPYYALALNNLAIQYMAIGNYDKALPLFQQATAINKSVLGEDHPNYAKSLNNESLLYSNLNQYDKAIDLSMQYAAIAKKVFGPAHPDYVIGLNNLAKFYCLAGKYEKVLPLYTEVLAVQRKVLGEEHPNYALCLNNLANYYYLVNNYDSSLYFYQQAFAIRKKVLGSGHPECATNLINLAVLYAIKGDVKEAAALFMQGSSIKLKNLTRTYTTLSEGEKMSFMTQEAAQFSYLPSLLFTQYGSPASLIRQLYQDELIIKGMILEDQKKIVNNVRSNKDSGTLQLYEEWRTTKSFLGKQLLLPMARRVPYFDSLLELSNRQEQELSRRAIGFKNMELDQPISITDISKKLQNGQAAVEFIRFPLYNKKWTDSIIYAALVLKPGDDISRFIFLCEEKQLKRLTGPAAVRTAGKLNDSLYNLVWKPLEKELADVHTIYYAPAGLLHRIAFQSLHSGSSQFLIDKYHLNQVFSTRSVALPSPATVKPVFASLWGNIDYGTHVSEMLASRGLLSGNDTIDTAAYAFDFYTSDVRGLRNEEWPSLPGTKKEMDNLAIIFKQANIHIVADSGLIATEEAFKALDGKSPKVLHLATHGFFLPVMEYKMKNNDMSTGKEAFTIQQNPMFRSGLVLAGGNHAWKGEPAVPGKEDGILTAYEIAQMDLSNTDLVVLSACETALGDIQGNEGVIGLQRAFKIAGVKQIIMSLWKVPDIETMKLMTLFYRNWLGGMSTREALRAAQLKMKEKYPPYYWAAFVLVE